MSKTRRPPPEILRKSHPHADVDERARGKRELLDALEDAMELEETTEEAAGTAPAEDSESGEADATDSESPNSRNGPAEESERADQ